jgi:Ca2+-binding EF-hand superfamily protein
MAERQYQAIFSIMDGDEDGLINVVEFKTLLDQLGGGSVTDETATSMFAAIDADGDGRVNLQELSAYLTTTSE